MSKKAVVVDDNGNNLMLEKNLLEVAEGLLQCCCKHKNRFRHQTVQSRS